MVARRIASWKRIQSEVYFMFSRVFGITYVAIFGWFGIVAHADFMGRWADFWAQLGCCITVSVAIASLRWAQLMDESVREEKMRQSI
jgi:hypothetical protein